MINEYYIFKAGNKQGPYTHSELMDMDLDSTDFLISPLAEGMQQARDLPEFKEYFRLIGIYIPTLDSTAGFWWRLLAYIIDYGLLFVIVMVVASIVGIASRFNLISLEPDNHEKPGLLLRLSFFLGMLLYHSIFEATVLQGSIGKLICKLIVVDINGQKLKFGIALGRNLSKILSMLLCGAGFLNIFWSPMRQSWHDQLLKTYVVRKS